MATATFTVTVSETKGCDYLKQMAEQLAHLINETSGGKENITQANIVVASS